MKKPFPPTARKLQRARRSGDVAKSRFLTAGAALFVGGALGLSALPLIKEFLRFFQRELVVTTDTTVNNVLASWSVAGWAFLAVIVPFFLVLWIAIVTVEVAQLRGVILNPVSFQWQRIALAKGLKRVFSPLPPEEGGEGVLLGSGWRFSLLSAVAGGAYLAGRAVWRSALALEERTPYEGAVWCGLVSFAVLVLFGLLGMACGVVSLWWSSQLRARRLSMDLEELKQELRDAQGEPLLKWARKQRHQELVSHTVLEEVRRAQIVVTGEVSPPKQDWGN
jgi:flagellar biosynthesis protein FlhB